ncbi:MAG: hypothetical protein IPP82_04300 [Xanthomonadales bacterium]|nr:hypothetical protein [Xanthomonadales bacterium]
MLKLTNTTLSENITQQSAALYANGDVAMKNVTVAYNTGANTGGVYIAEGVAHFDNSIFSDNASSTTTSTSTDLRCVPSAFSDGYNLWRKANCPIATPKYRPDVDRSPARHLVGRWKIPAGACPAAGQPGAQFRCADSERWQHGTL